MRKVKFKKENLSIYIFGCSFFLIVIGIICFRPAPFLFVPLLVTAVIMLLQSRVNRYAFFIGAINSLLYAVAYMKMSLYATALSAIFVSFPIQVMTFINWQRHTEKKETKLRKMSAVTRLRLFGGMLVSWPLLYIIFMKMNAQYLLLDNSVAILGTIGAILTALRFKEYPLLQIVTSVISIITYLMMLKEDPSRIIWVISSANTMICAFLAWKKMNGNGESKEEKGAA